MQVFRNASGLDSRFPARRSPWNHARMLGNLFNRTLHKT